MEIPAHRRPFIVPRSELVMLTVDVPEVARAFAPEIGMVPGEFRSRGHGGLHEMGVISLASHAPAPVYLLLPSNRPRTLQAIETVSKLTDSVVLIPGYADEDETLRRLASERGVSIRSLQIQTSRVLVGVMPGASKGSTHVFPPSPGWTWEMLNLDFSHERFVATIAGQRFEGRWSQHGVSVIHNGQRAGFIEMLLQLADGESLEQKRSDPAQRQRVSRFRATLRRLFPLEGEPVRGGVAAFRVSSKSGKRTAQRVLEIKQSTKHETTSPHHRRQ